MVSWWKILVDKFLKARELTMTVVEEVQTKAFVGMSEIDGEQLINQALATNGNSAGRLF